MSTSVTLLFESMSQNQSLVCCGLDPVLELMPNEYRKKGGSDSDAVVSFLCDVVDITAPYVCAFKLQRAFFDFISDDAGALRAVVSYIRTRYPALPIFLDSKIGDIGNTMKAYLDAAFKRIEVDGVVVNPYMGDDVMAPFELFPDKSAIVLVKTSNSGGDVVQDVRLADGQPLWKYMLKQVVERWNKAGNLIPVLSSTHHIDYNNVRLRIPDTMPILLAGYGAQGGSLGALSQLLNSDRSGVFINSSRGLLYPYTPSDPNWRERVLEATVSMRDQANGQR